MSEPQPSPATLKAQEELCRAVDAWFTHMRHCDREECATCDAGFKHAQTAHAVWSRRRAK